MKAWKILSMTICLSGCIYAGEYNILPIGDVLAGLSGHHIDYLVSQDERLLDSEDFHETSRQQDVNGLQRIFRRQYKGLC